MSNLRITDLVSDATLDAQAMEMIIGAGLGRWIRKKAKQVKKGVKGGSKFVKRVHRYRFPRNLRQGLGYVGAWGVSPAGMFNSYILK